MTLHCTVLDDYQGVALTAADWSPLRGRVEVSVLREHVADEDDLVRRLTGSDVIVIMRERTPFPARLLAQLPRLRLLVTSGMRNASVDVAAAMQRGITVCGTGSALRPPAELTWALILGLARHLVPESEAMRAGGPWQSTVGIDIAGARLGLLGLGNIGAQVARVGLAFGMDVHAWSQHLTPERAAAEGVHLAPSTYVLVAGADFVSIHLVLGNRTRGLVDAATIAQMRPSAFLINTSRAAIVDQTALLDALQAGRIAGAGLDVFDIEPLPADHAFRTLPNVLATPHLGYVTVSNYRRYFAEAVEDIATFLDGRPVRVIGT